MVWIFLLSELVWWCRPCRQVRDGRLVNTIVLQAGCRPDREGQIFANPLKRWQLRAAIAPPAHASGPLKPPFSVS